jgi:thiol-disulfide isomerase/thioredoxin
VKRNGLVFLVLCVAILAMVASGKYLNRNRKVKQTALVGNINGRLAPDFDLASLDGKRVKLSDFRGKAVLLNFWATWCAPCKEEMPWFVDLQKKYAGDGLVVVGVAMDDSDASKIAEFTGEMGVNYPVLLGTDKVSDDYGNVDFLPTSFYIDRDGKFVGKGVGLLGRKEVEDNIQKALASPVVGANASANHPDPKAATQQPTAQ